MSNSNPIFVCCLLTNVLLGEAGLICYKLEGLGRKFKVPSGNYPHRLIICFTDNVANG